MNMECQKHLDRKKSLGVKRKNDKDTINQLPLCSPTAHEIQTFHKIEANVNILEQYKRIKFILNTANL